MERCLQTSWRPIGCLPIKPYHGKARLPQSLYSDNFPCYIITSFSNKCAAINEWPVAIWSNKKFGLFSKRNDVQAGEERGKFIAHKVLAQLTLEYSPLLNFVYSLVQSSKPVVAHCHQQECFRIQFSA